MESVSNSPQLAPQWGFLELLDRSGKVFQRLRVSELPISVGRAYDNDIIVTDRYVCPHHLRVDVNDMGQLVAEDLGSVNGLFIHGHKRPVPQADLSGGQTLAIGHTRLRYRTATHMVEPTLADHHTHKLVGAYESRLVQGLLVLLAAGILWLSNFLDIVEKAEASKPLFQLIYPAGFVILWAGLWAFAGRIVTQRIKFLVHAAIACMAIVVVFAFDTALDYFTFAFAADHYQTLLSLLGGLGVLTLVLYSHLRFCTLASPARLATISGAISIAAIGLLAVNTHIESDRFRAGPSVHATLKAPPFKLVAGEPAADFFDRAQDLKKRLATAVDE